jgi:hypothetical protein
LATVPTPPDFSDGASSSSQLNQLRDAIKFLQRPPIAELRQAAAQTVTNTTWTAITFDTEDVDTDIDGTGGTGGHSTSSNTSRYTARYAGWYDVGGGVGWSVNATGARGTYWSVNGIAQNGSHTLEAAVGVINAGYAARSIQVYLAVGDYLELFAWQSSGGNLNTSASAAEQSSMKVRWVSL